MSFLSKNRIRAAQLFNDAYVYLSEKYKQSADLFTPASPFGQILSVVSNIGEMIFFYIEAAITELNILRARNTESIFGLSRLTGHDPLRGISATGVLELKIKPGGEDLFNGNFVRIENFSKVNCVNNSVTYFLDLDADFIKLEKTANTPKQVRIIQGEIDSQVFTGTGLPLQSFSIVVNEATDNNYVKVKVNGEIYTIEESLYDMGNNSPSCMLKTGISGGLDVYFGTGNFGKIPPAGSSIEVPYVRTVGSIGNIDTDKNLVFEFVDDGTDSTGGEVNLKDVVGISTIQAPNFGADNENPEFTRLIAPYASKSFVLANPTNYIYFLRKYGYFSVVNAYNTKNDQYLDDDNIVYLFLIPDVSKKLLSNQDYFNVPEEEFTLTQQEQERVKTLLNQSGQQLVTSDVRIVPPTVRKYAINIILRYVEGFDKREITNDIREKLSQYFLNVTRRDGVPRSDIVAIIESIQGIDSVNVYFISEANERAIRDGYYFVPIFGYDSVTQQRIIVENKKITINEGEDPMLGLDEFGDIKIAEEDLAIIRGGWYDRNENFYEELPNPNALSSLNVFFKESIPNDLYARIERNRFNTLVKKNQEEATTQINRNNSGAIN
jgi:hypothetical protein